MTPSPMRTPPFPLSRTFETSYLSQLFLVKLTAAVLEGTVGKKSWNDSDIPSLSLQPGQRALY